VRLNYPIRTRCNVAVHSCPTHRALFIRAIGIIGHDWSTVPSLYKHRGQRLICMSTFGNVLTLYKQLDMYIKRCPMWLNRCWSWVEGWRLGVLVNGVRIYLVAICAASSIFFSQENNRRMAWWRGQPQLHLLSGYEHFMCCTCRRMLGGGEVKPVSPHFTTLLGTLTTTMLH